ncbi:hypothetical protein [Candidatus Nitrotoga sp. AM1P]|uniref:hypothetical protein n=1 Tax=Candidatus Nitrotoga sp. AM1P TaxID=2559597 RepID=UPI0010B36CFC|nr:hypothetical protein [Candidatus Nitrotoga sp. AM1P]BBJ23086.1 hypothetical protein W01_10130 [Candidatus Nitrotoga sp. AM1P]
MIITALVVATLLCFVMPATRGFGVIGIAILLYFFPLTTMTLLVVGAVFVYFIYFYNK